MIIDFHTHVFSPEVKNNRGFYIAHDPHFAPLYSNPRSKIITADELIESMDQAGIDISIILGFYWTTDKLCVEANDYILESVSRYPDRLVGFCAARLESGEAALREIERCARAGLKGVGEIRPGTNLMKNRGLMEPFAEVLMKHRLILLIHASEPVGHEYAGKGDVTPEELYPLFTAFPELPVVCAHWGGGLPFYALMPEVKQALKNAYFDTAVSPFLYSPRIYEIAIQLVGAEKLLFGTDYPVLSQKRHLKEIESQNLPSEAKNMLLAGNAQRLLGIGR